MLKMLLVGILLLSCKAVEKFGTNELRLLSATRQQLFAGAKGGGVITEFNVEVEVMTNQPLKTDSIWVGKHRFFPKVVNKVTHAPAQNRQAGDILLLIYSVQFQPAGFQENVQPEEDAPIAYKGAAVLRYYLGSTPTPQYLVIPAFTELEAVHAP